MKKLIMMIMIAVMATISLCSCGSTNDTCEGLDKLNEEELVHMYEYVVAGVDLDDIQIVHVSNGCINALVSENGLTYSMNIDREQAIEELAAKMS